MRFDRFVKANIFKDDQTTTGQNDVKCLSRLRKLKSRSKNGGTLKTTACSTARLERSASTSLQRTESAPCRRPLRQPLLEKGRCCRPDKMLSLCVQTPVHWPQTVSTFIGTRNICTSHPSPAVICRRCFRTFC